jgi:hypothetical protein
MSTVNTPASFDATRRAKLAALVRDALSLNSANGRGDPGAIHWWVRAEAAVWWAGKRGLDPAAFLEACGEAGVRLLTHEEAAAAVAGLERAVSAARAAMELASSAAFADLLPRLEPRPVATATDEPAAATA